MMPTEGDLIAYAVIGVVIFFILFFIIKILMGRDRGDAVARRRSWGEEQSTETEDQEGEGASEGRSLGFRSICPNCYSPVPPKATECKKCRSTFWSPLIEQTDEDDEPFMASETLFDGSGAGTLRAYCPRCNARVGPSDKSCPECKERFWSPIIAWED